MMVGNDAVAMQRELVNTLTEVERDNRALRIALGELLDASKPAMRDRLVWSHALVVYLFTDPGQREH